MTIHPKTAKEALNTYVPQVSALKREMGEMVLNALLTLAVSDLVNSFNIGKTMNDEQIVFVVETIKTDYYFIRPDELKYCFNQAKKGRYGQIYDRIDCATICQWIDKYLVERLEVIYELAEEEEKRNEANFKIVLSLKNSKGESLKVLDFEPKEEIKPETPIKSISLHQKWLNHFDFLHKKYSDERTPIIRHIKRYGTSMDIEKFFNKKLEQLQLSKSRNTIALKLSK